MTMPGPEVFTVLERQLPLRGLAWPTPYGEGQWPEAAVLVALTNEASPRVVLGRRARHLPLHPGEVAFPGGKREAEDLTPWMTALREAAEEVGLPGVSVAPLGELAPLLTRTGFQVHPCVAQVPPVMDLVVDPGNSTVSSCNRWSPSPTRKPSAWKRCTARGALAWYRTTRSAPIISGGHGGRTGAAG